MNNVLQLKGEFKSRKNPRTGFGTFKLPKDKKITAKHIEDLAEDLESAYGFWKDNLVNNGALVALHYNRIVPKSLRAERILKDKHQNPNDTIKGVRFETLEENGNHKNVHVFTHFVSLNSLHSSAERLRIAASVLNKYFGGEATTEVTEKIAANKYATSIMKHSELLQYIKDASVLNRISCDDTTHPIKGDSIVCFYDISPDMAGLLSQYDVMISSDRKLDNSTFCLTEAEYEKLRAKMPYLIAMGVNNLLDIPVDTSTINEQGILEIPDPTNEPIIGVIDTPFYKDTYLSKWVTYHDMMPKEINIHLDDYKHGTEVSSIIVDGPSFNPNLQDNCGRFRVRHFGVAPSGSYSSFELMKKIRQIVSTNRDIKVWNLSLGSRNEINQNYISPEAAELDKLQNEYDIIFVVAGTNKEAEDVSKIGAPADSLNSLVVNSVDFTDKAASYTRKGPVLSFYHKPDVSYYGGDGSWETRIRTCCPTGEAFVAGTSFAAPWMCRKLAYLINVMGLNRELAKALILDAAAGWDVNGNVSDSIGYGIVPVDIHDILMTKNDEIKCVLSGTIEEYETYTYNLPVPVVNDKFPYYGKATLVYFPVCCRNQGVDYTTTEMDLHFGRVSDNGIVSIDKNNQGAEGCQLYEEDARKMFRKWDNIKHICEPLKEKPRPRKLYSSKMWGIEVKTKDRNKSNSRGLKFGIVITLKAMDAVNRIDDFIQMCSAREWIVNPLDIDNQINIYNASEKEIILE